jgi:DNA-binding NarL/FixJ family response regulator
VTRTAVILHERLGTWSAQLRPRLRGRPVHWIETRSATDLDEALLGLACPVVLIDLKRKVVEGLSDLDRLVRLFPGARVLVLDPEAHDGVAELARELGATHVISGFVPPTEVACLIDRWIILADRQTESAGWSRPMTTDTPLDPEEWIQSTVGNQAQGSR